MENIKKLAEQGFKFFRCYANKAPATGRGFYDATDNIEKLEKMFHNNDFLAGMPTGNTNKIVVIDFDINKPLEDKNGKKIKDSSGNDVIDIRTVDELIEEVKQNYDNIPETFTVQSPSGGLHFYYKIENTSLSSKRRFIDNTLPIDIRANGGYVIAPDGKSNYIVYDDFDDLGINDLLSRCTALPEWIKNHKKNNSCSEKNEVVDNILPPSEIKEIRSALSFVSSDDRDLWIRVGMALKSTGSPSAFPLFDEWSKTSEKYDANDMEKRWKGLRPNDITIASLFHLAKEHGWVTTYDQQHLLPENIEIIKKSFKKKPFPKELLRPPGLVGEFMDYVEFKSIKSQPIYALAGCLTAVGALLGRKICTDSDIRTNIYTLGVGASGSGKEACRSVIKKCFYEAGAGTLAKVDDLASDASIITALYGQESQIFLLDEIGRFLQTTNTAGASRNTHLYNIISVLLKLYSNSNSVYEGKAYADKDKQVTLLQPNLCIYGTTIPDTLYRGLTSASLTDGFLSRMLIFESEDNNPKKKRRRELRGISKTPQSLLDKIAHIYAKPINANPVGNIDHSNPKPQIVPLNENALDMVEDFEDYVHDLREKLIKEERPDGIYNRSSQMAEQIALIIAGGVNPDNPVITEKEMQYGIIMANYLADNMLYIAENFVADNEYEHALKWILGMIKDAGKISLSKLTHKTQKLKTYERNDILMSLIESSQIIDSYEGEGSKKTRYLVSI